MSSKIKEITQRDSAMTQMISWFDGYASLHIVDPSRIERLLKSKSGTDLDRIWKSVKKDVETIVELPAGSEQVKKYSRISSVSRLLSVILAAASFVFLIIIYAFQSDLVKLGIEFIAPALVIGILYVMIMVSVYAGRKMNSSIRDYYQEHTHALSKSRTRIKESAQMMIDRLQQDVVSHNLNPGRYSFKVFDKDYRNINVLDGRGPRYTATVRTKAHKER